MPGRQKAKKDVANCDKPRGAVAGFDPGISEWGNPYSGNGIHPPMQFGGSKRGEVKHLSTLRKRNQSRFPQ